MNEKDINKIVKKSHSNKNFKSNFECKACTIKCWIKLKVLNSKSWDENLIKKRPQKAKVPGRGDHCNWRRAQKMDYKQQKINTSMLQCFAFKEKSMLEIIKKLQYGICFSKSPVSCSVKDCG